ARRHGGARVASHVPPRREPACVWTARERTDGHAGANRRGAHSDRTSTAADPQAAWMMDAVGNKAARMEIAMIKVAAPTMACRVIDWAIQAHGGAGVSDDFPLAFAYAAARTLRLADGPDEVHRNQIARWELKKHAVDD